MTDLGEIIEEIFEERFPGRKVSAMISATWDLCVSKAVVKVKVDNVCAEYIIDESLTDIAPALDALEKKIREELEEEESMDVQNGVTDSWIECRNPEGLNRDVSVDGYCAASIRRM